MPEQLADGCRQVRTVELNVTAERIRRVRSEERSIILSDVADNPTVAIKEASA